MLETIVAVIQVMSAVILTGVVAVEGKNQEGGYRTWAKWGFAVLGLAFVVNLFYVGLRLDEFMRG